MTSNPSELNSKLDQLTFTCYETINKLEMEWKITCYQTLFFGFIFGVFIGIIVGIRLF